LQFLLQADFLLIASREDIDSSSAWNQRLLSVVPEAFVSGVGELIKGDLRYTWMRYLPERPHFSDLFERLESETLQLLSLEAVVESLAGHMTVPTELRMLPDLYCDTDRKPLVRTNKTEQHYLSSQYSLTDSEWLLRIGVQLLSPPEFLNDLISILSEQPKFFQEKLPSWHRRLCRALTSLINNDTTMKTEISRLPIIPLQDGRWIPANRGVICFPYQAKEQAGWTVPEGIGIYAIDAECAKDHFRQTLYAMLGVREFSKELVCDAIITLLETPQYDYETGRPRIYAPLIAFLYKSNWKNTQGHNLWLVTDHGKFLHGSKIYMQHAVPLSASVFFLRSPDLVSFLHPRYLEYLPFATNEDFQLWMVDNFNLARYPRLVTYLSLNSFKISDDFIIVVETAPPISVLLLLRERWAVYSKWLAADDEPTDHTWENSKAILRDRFAILKVPCRGGKVALLKNTVVPLGDMFPEELDSLFLLDIPEPQDPRWKYLSCFGVVTEAGVGPIIQCLRHIRDSTTASAERISELYRLVQAQAGSYGETIR
jgi:hypothetical protein